jgi:hypothetical protein
MRSVKAGWRLILSTEGGAVYLSRFLVYRSTATGLLGSQPLWTRVPFVLLPQRILRKSMT